MSDCRFGDAGTRFSEGIGLLDVDTSSDCLEVEEKADESKNLEWLWYVRGGELAAASTLENVGWQIGESNTLLALQNFASKVRVGARYRWKGETA